MPPKYQTGEVRTSPFLFSASIETIPPLFSAGNDASGAKHHRRNARFPEVRGKIGNRRAQRDFRQQNRRSRKIQNGVWSADLGFSPHFRNPNPEVCGKFRNPRAHRPFRAKKPQVDALQLFRMVDKSQICRILPNASAHQPSKSHKDLVASAPAIANT